VKQAAQLANSMSGESRDLPAEVSLQDPRDVEMVDHRSPVHVIGSRQWTTLDLRDLWLHRELFLMLAWRDVKVRYKQSILGVAWVILQPLLTMIIFTLLFGRLAKMPSEGRPYAIFSYAGLLPWTFFAEGVTGGSNSLINSSNLITKVYFPRLLIPTATVGAGLVDFTIASMMLFVIMPVYHVAFHLTMLMFFPLVVLLAMVAASVAIFTSGMNVKFRDIRHALPFAVQLWMFLTPVIYPVSFLPERWRWLLKLNPLSGIIEGFRAAIFGGPFDWSGLAVSAVTVAVLLVITGYAFRRMERVFADVI
jgi:lipopolysaccharide transport system permease protein